MNRYVYKKQKDKKQNDIFHEDKCREVETRNKMQDTRSKEQETRNREQGTIEKLTIIMIIKNWLMNNKE